jgi:hypothetical protein
MLLFHILAVNEASTSALDVDFLGVKLPSTFWGWRQPALPVVLGRGSGQMLTLPKATDQTSGPETSLLHEATYFVDFQL